MARLSKERYAQLYGPTTGDRIWLADTSLLVEVTEDRCGGPGLAVTRRCSAAAGAAQIHGPRAVRAGPMVPPTP